MKIIDSLNEWSQKWRAQNFAKLFKFLTEKNVTANKITFFRALGAPLMIILFPRNPQAAVIVALIVGLSDFFDGGLARYQNTSSDRGKFWDVLVDNGNYVFGVYALISSGFFSNQILSFHLVISPIMFLLATIKESENRTTDWIIHSYYTDIYFKPVAIVSVVLFAFFSTNFVNETFFLLNIAMTITAMYYVWVLHKRWQKAV